MDRISTDSEERARSTTSEQESGSSRNPQKTADAVPEQDSGAAGRSSAPAPQAAPSMGPLRPSDVDFMPGLLRSLSVLLRLRGRAVSPHVLMAGLSGSKVTPQACLRAARKAGLTGRIAYRPDIADIPGLVLPCILLLSHDRSCVLTALDGDMAEVIFPETSESTQLVPLEALTDEYSGYALFAAVESAPDDRSERLSIARANAGSGMCCGITRLRYGTWPW